MPSFGITDPNRPYGLPADDRNLQHVEKPEAPALEDIRRDLDQLRHALEQGADAEGTVDAKDLWKRVWATRDHTLIHELETLLGPSVYPHSTGSRAGDPRTITREQVQRALSDLAQAEEAFEKADVDGDGRLSYAEAHEDVQGNKPYHLATTATSDVNRAMHAWQGHVRGAEKVIARRKLQDEAIEKTVDFHAKTPTGKAALRAYLRDQIARGGLLLKYLPWENAEGVHSARITKYGTAAGAANSALWNAEKGAAKLLHTLGIFERKAQGHLDDGEIRRFLKTEDLAAYTQKTYAHFEEAFGGSYEDAYLAGKDLDAHDDLADPDAHNPKLTSMYWLDD